MNRLVLLLALVMAWSCGAEAQATFRAQEGDFVIDFPAAPTVQSRPARRSKDVAQRRYIDDESGRIYSVNVEEYPDGALPPSPNESTYDRVLQSLAGDDARSLKSTRPARLSGRPCLEGTFEDMDGDVRIVRVLMLGDRIYEVSYIHASGVDSPGAATAFFDSFKVTAP